MMERDASGGGRRVLYVGCYTPDGGPGIHAFDASTPDGILQPLSEHGGVEDASYLAAGTNGDVLYAVSEQTAPRSGEVVALRIDGRDGSLAEFDRVPSHGAAPCHVAVTVDGRHLYVANYIDGTMAAYALLPDGGFDALLSRHEHAGSGPRSERQEGPHTHGVLPRPSGAVLVTDLGTDQLLRYHHDGGDGSGPLVVDDVLQMPPGTGPRHAVSHPSRPELVLVVGELDSSLTVVVDRLGDPLRALGHGSTLPATVDTASSTAAAVVVPPRGDLAYVSNRGSDTVAVLDLTAGSTPTLRAVVPSGGRTPRDLLLHPSGRHLVVANQDDDLVTVLALGEDGVPSAVVDEHELPAPAGLVHMGIAL
jgi:6-phosphogluconolactonase